MIEQVKTPVDTNEDDLDLVTMLATALGVDKSDITADGDYTDSIPDDRVITLDEALNEAKLALLMCALGGPGDVAKHLNVVGTYLERQVDARDAS